jgi:hypothetical protein
MNSDDEDNEDDWLDDNDDGVDDEEFEMKMSITSQFAQFQKGRKWRYDNDPSAQPVWILLEHSGKSEGRAHTKHEEHLDEP